MYYGTLLGTDRPTGASGKRQELSTFHVSQKTLFCFVLFLATRSPYQSKAKKQFSFGKTRAHIQAQGTRDVSQ